MREYKFRGKCIEEGKTSDNQWVYGSLIIYKDTVWIVSDCQYHYEVQPKTVGEWTGAQDAKGVDIYEGDICKNTYWGDSYPTQIRTEIETVVYDKTEFGFVGCNFNRDGETCEIIGSLHDNPELLEVKNVKN